MDGNSVVNADGVAEIVTPQILGEVADVKVDGQSVVDSEGVAQITLPDSANAISYDNSESGLDSTNIQDAVDEVLDKANKVDDVQTYGGNTLVTNKIADLSALTMKKSIPSTPTAIATFSDGAEMVMPSLTVGVEAVQDLHGYDSPWVGGAGKNKWEPITGTYRGITFSLENDGKIKASGQVSTAGYIQLGYDIALEDSPFSVGDSITIKSSSNTQCVVRFLRSDSTYTQISSSNGVATTDTIPNDCVTLRLIEYAGTSSYSVGNNINLIMTFQVEKGTIASDWTPYSNICPISGWSEANVGVVGKNWLNATSDNFIYSGDSPTGKVVIENNGLTLSTSLNGTYGFILPVVGGNTYKIALNKLEGGTHYCRLRTYSSKPTSFDDAYIDTYESSALGVGRTVFTRTMPSNANYLFVGVYRSYSTAGTSITDMLVTLGENTDFEPYNGHTYNIDLDGTRYGGELDVVSGVLTVTHGSVVFDGSNDEDWIVADASGHYRGHISIANIKPYTGAHAGISELYICSMLVNGTWNGVFSGDLVAGMTGQNWGFGLDSLQITDTTGLRNWLSTNQIEIVYELETPLTIQLTPTAVKSLDGDNNVFADSGEILEGEYIADASAVIAGLDARITALENA